MRRRYRRLGALTLSALAVAALTACTPGKITEPFNDAQRGAENSGKMDVVTMSDGFSNVGTKCDHGNRIYVTFHGDGAYAALAVVAQDPTCR